MCSKSRKTILLRSLHPFLLLFSRGARVLLPEHRFAALALSLQPRTKAVRAGNCLRCGEGSHLLSGEAAGMPCPGTNHYPEAAASAAGTQLTCSSRQPCSAWHLTVRVCPCCADAFPSQPATGAGATAAGHLGTPPPLCLPK